MSLDSPIDNASARAAQIPVKPVQRPLDLIPVGLKEAALDSPTFRATVTHFTEQIDLVERWLEGYVRQASKLASEVAALETVVNNLIAASLPPVQIDEATIDHDYTLLAVRRYGEGARDFWQATLRGAKRYEHSVVDPIKNFLGNEIRAFREARRTLETNQRAFDSTITRFVAQSKNKEASSLREDAFQLHEARKAYLKSSLDFGVAAPQLRSAVDKLLVRVFTDQWKEMRSSRDANASLLTSFTSEMERVKGWSRELENSERAFNRELFAARQQIEENALLATRPSRGIDDYAASTVAYLGAPPAPSSNSTERSEKQGWLFMRGVTGKPARTTWSRKWFFVKNGIFGWLVQGTRSGGVEESDKIGVLLCGVRPWFQEERRFCFEVKTKDTSIILQAETQQELTDWISAFEVAKRKALEDPLSTELSAHANIVDPAFAVSPPAAPEFAVRQGESSVQEEGTSSLAVAESPALGQPPRPSFDVGSSRRVTGAERETDGARDHAARLISKLDLHKRSATTSSSAQAAPAPGGIASLISASHNILPVGPGAPSLQPPELTSRSLPMPASTLAPSTLINCPTTTGLSHTAVVLSGERGLSLGRTNGSGTPSGLMANTWGSNYWGSVSQIDDNGSNGGHRSSSQSVNVITHNIPISRDDSEIMEGSHGIDEAGTAKLGIAEINTAKHRKTFSADVEEPVSAMAQINSISPITNYPLPLKAQQAQFRMLFPNVPENDKLVLVFRATWSPNEQQEFPGRVYVTTSMIYLFSNHLGLVLITGIKLSAVEEVTAAPGRDCDFLYFHLREDKNPDDLRRITVKVFLEPLRLLQRRLNYMVRNAVVEEPDLIEHVLNTLINMEKSDFRRRSSADSWEDLTYDAPSPSHAKAIDGSRDHSRNDRNINAPLRIDGTLYGDFARTGREVQRFKLPRQAVSYVPKEMQTNISREFNISAKALFHVIFGDKSAVFQLLLGNRWADRIEQTPWTKDTPDGRWQRRFVSHSHNTALADSQSVDVMNDHLCYVITNFKDPWRLPYASRFKLVTKFVITHSSKSRSKLSVFQKVEWKGVPPLEYFKRLVEKEALDSLDTDALQLSNVAVDQVAKLGKHSKTIRAVEIFGNVGKQVTVPELDVRSIPNLKTSVAKNSAKSLRSVTLGRLIMDDVLFRILNVLGWILDVAMAICKSVLSVCSTHNTLVLILTISVLYNSWHSYRDGLLWVQERRATAFMNRLGVHPDLTMGKAVYLKDIEQLVAKPTEGAILEQTNVDMRLTPQSNKSCRSTFRTRILSSPDSATLSPKNDMAAHRLQRSRDSLARHRHDLLVALRVVNSVEQDVVTSEWHTWVHDEERKCDRMLSTLQHLNRTMNFTISEGDRASLQDYCQSCRAESARINSADQNRLI